VAPAVSVGRLVREALAEIADARPFFDSEHGPIHTFKDYDRTLEEAFDDEYFRHIQWAHLASGAAGGGMRWPNRHPHVLTHGMRRAQRGLADFLPLIDWPRFRRRSLWEEATISDGAAHLFACGDDRQAALYLLRGDTIGETGLLRPDAPPLSPK
jgi:mannan endo-1,4-beta-mannosidase